MCPALGSCKNTFPFFSSKLMVYKHTHTHTHTHILIFCCTDHDIIVQLLGDLHHFLLKCAGSKKTLHIHTQLVLTGRWGRKKKGGGGGGGGFYGTTCWCCSKKVWSSLEAQLLVLYPSRYIHYEHLCKFSLCESFS